MAFLDALKQYLLIDDNVFLVVMDAANDVKDWLNYIVKYYDKFRKFKLQVKSDDLLVRTWIEAIVNAYLSKFEWMKVNNDMS